MRSITMLFLVLSLVAPITTVYADPGDLDTSFGNNGGVRLDLGGDEYVAAAALDENGLILIGGVVNDDIFIARLRKNGNLDVGNFGEDYDGDSNPDGYIIEDLGGDEGLSEVLVDNDRRIYAVGTSDLLGTYVYSARFFEDGTLDTTYGSVLTPGFINHLCYLTSMAYGAALDPAPNLYIYGQWTSGTAKGLYVALDSSGNPVINCASDSPSGNTLADRGRDVLYRDTDGKVVVMGQTANDLYVSRYLAFSASKDTTFGTNGYSVLNHIGVSNNPATIISAAQMTTDENGGHAHYQKPVVAASADGNFLAVRFTEDGDLDTTFSGDGLRTVDFGGTDWCRAVAIDRKGRIILAGEVSGEVGLVRIKVKGKLDKSFGPNSDGKVVTAVNGAVGVRTVLVTANKRILVVCGVGNNLPNKDILVFRYHAL